MDHCLWFPGGVSPPRGRPRNKEQVPIQFLFAKATLPRPLCQGNFAKATLPRQLCQGNFAKATLPRQLVATRGIGKSTLGSVRFRLGLGSEIGGARCGPRRAAGIQAERGAVASDSTEPMPWMVRNRNPFALHFETGG